MKEYLLKKISNIDKIENENEINKLFKKYLEYTEDKKKSIFKEKQNLIKSNQKLEKEIEDIKSEIKVLENDKNNIIMNSKLKIEKTLNEIKKVENECELQKIIKENELELNLKKLENGKMKKLKDIYISFIEEKNKIDGEINKKIFLQKQKKLEYERIKDSIYLNFIKNSKELDCELFDIKLRKKKYSCKNKIQMNIINNSKSIELQKINNEKRLFLKEIEYERQIINLNCI